MTEEEKSKPEEGSTREEAKEPTPEDALNAIRASIANAFNLGLQSQPKQPTDTTADLIKGLQVIISGQLKQAYGDDVSEDFIRANAEFFVQIAAVGYIIPRICAHDKDFQARLFQLIEDRVLETQKQAAEKGQGEQGTIIHEDKKIIV